MSLAFDGFLLVCEAIQLGSYFSSIAWQEYSGALSRYFCRNAHELMSQSNNEGVVILRNPVKAWPGSVRGIASAAASVQVVEMNGYVWKISLAPQAPFILFISSNHTEVIFNFSPFLSSEDFWQDELTFTSRLSHWRSREASIPSLLLAHTPTIPPHYESTFRPESFESGALSDTRSWSRDLFFSV